jgi:small subunit ribosomal protein S4
MRITLDTKCRLCRTEGQKLFLKGARCLSAKCPIEKKGAVPPGMHGIKSMKKPTDYGLQLRAKQKAKRIFGIQETQFRNYYELAKKQKGLVGDNLMNYLQHRLDNVVYVSGLAASRTQAKQLISHKHVLVNNLPINISSYNLKIGDVITLAKDTLQKTQENLHFQDKDFKLPDWLDLDKNKSTVKIISIPEKNEIESGINTNLIIEYYSR